MLVILAKDRKIRDEHHQRPSCRGERGNRGRANDVHDDMTVHSVQHVLLLLQNIQSVLAFGSVFYYIF